MKIELTVVLEIDVNQPMTGSEAQKLSVKIDPRLIGTGLQIVGGDLVPIDADIVGHETTLVDVVDDTP